MRAPPRAPPPRFCLRARAPRLCSCARPAPALAPPHRWLLAHTSLARALARRRADIEFELNGEQLTPPSALRVEVAQYHAWRRSEEVQAAGLRPLRTELTVAYRIDGLVVSAGQIDALFVDGNGLHYLVDFKRSRKPLDPDTPTFGRTGSGPVGHVPDTAFHRYSLQASLYAVMLLQTHHLLCNGGLYLLRMHTDAASYEMVQCEDLTTEAVAMLQAENERLLATPAGTAATHEAVPVAADVSFAR